MIITIDELVFPDGLRHTTTEWLVQEYLDDALVNEVSVPFGTNRVTLTYAEYSVDSVFYVTTTRKLSDDTILSPVTDMKSFNRVDNTTTTELVTPTIYKPSELTISLTMKELILTSSPLKSFIGEHEHMSSTWIVRDSSGCVLFRRNRSKDDKTSIAIKSETVTGVGVITVEVIYHTLDNKKSFIARHDFNLVPIKYVDNMVLTIGDDTDSLQTNVTNYLRFIKLDQCEDSYKVKIVTHTGEVLVDNIVTDEIIELILDDIIPGTVVSVEIVGTLVGDFNLMGGIPRVKRDYIVSDKYVKTVNVDSSNIVAELVSTIDPGFEMDSCSTIELANNTIPLVNLDSKILEFYYMSGVRLIKSDNQTLLLDAADVTILPGVKIKLIDNSILVVAYNQEDNVSHDRSTVFRLYKVITSLNYGIKFTEIHVESVLHPSAMTDSEAEIFFNCKENHFINWTHDISKLTDSYNFKYDSSTATPVGYTNLEAVADISLNAEEYSNILVSNVDGVTISKVTDNTISDTVALGNTGPAITISMLDDILYSLITSADTVEIKQIK